MPSLDKIHVGDVDGWKIYTVDGDYVRLNHEMDYLQGGNPKRFDWFIPDGEIWVDRAVPAYDVPFVVYHEIHESRLMASGVSYDDAHRICNGTDRLLLERRLKDTAKTDEEVYRECRARAKELLDGVTK